MEEELLDAPSLSIEESVLPSCPKCSFPGSPGRYVKSVFGEIAENMNEKHLFEPNLNMAPCGDQSTPISTYQLQSNCF